MAENMDSFELIVHIGTGKTGSSSIQKTLAANKAQLKGNGSVYLGLMFEETPNKKYGWQKAGGWPDLIALGAPLAQEQLQTVLVQTVRELAGSGCRRAIWSNETLFANQGMIIPILKHLESLGVAIKVIVYLRRHDAYIRSAYLQWGIKHKSYSGPLKPFSEWRQSHRPSFFATLKPWLDAGWNDVAVRNFDACRDVVTDFLDCYGLRTPDMVIRRENETPSATALALWAMFNGQFDEQVLPVQLQKLLRQADLLEKTPRDCDFSSLLPTVEEIEKVKDESAEDRNRINAVFRQFSQPEMDESPLKPKQMLVTQNQINAALLMIIKNQGDQITLLKRKINDLIGKGDRFEE